jgi:hypothetical protein
MFSVSEKTRSLLLTAGVSLVTALGATLATIEMSKMNVRATYINSVGLKVFDERIRTYPELFSMIVELSVHRPTPLTMEDGVPLGHRINEWLYGDGGLYASAGTRRAVADLRSALIGWDATDDQASIRKARVAREIVIYQLRADLSLEGDLQIDPEMQPRTEIQEHLDALDRG